MMQRRDIYHDFFFLSEGFLKRYRSFMDQGTLEYLGDRECYHIVYLL